MRKKRTSKKRQKAREKGRGKGGRGLTVERTASSVCKHAKTETEFQIGSGACQPLH